ncbi:MAG TPA: MFS transporter [Leucothrix mucor]|nr:MFS transporter [Leucothrix mucor]
MNTSGVKLSQLSDAREDALKPAKGIPYSVYLLAVCQSLMQSSNILMIAVSALACLPMLEDKSLVTLPISLQFFSMMLTSVPASLFMGKFGRKAGFMLASFIGMMGGLLAIIAILNNQFWLFSLAAVCLGVFNGFGNYYRFAAVDLVHVEFKSRAISYVMVGGVFAALIGPNLSTMAKYVFAELKMSSALGESIANSQFAGAFFFVIAFYILTLLILSFIKLPEPDISEFNGTVRPWRELISQPKFSVALICGMLGYGVMSLVMTATPLAMMHHAHNFTDTMFVIQWHVLAMFVPSFFTGSLIMRFGVVNILLWGVIFAFVCVVINLVGQSTWHFTAALIFLGFSWNFLFIGATSLLTDSYKPQEKSKSQAINDFLVFTTVTIASLSAGVLQHQFGWQMVNIGVVPLIVIMLLSVLKLKYSATI